MAMDSEAVGEATIIVEMRKQDDSAVSHEVVGAVKRQVVALGQCLCRCVVVSIDVQAGKYESTDGKQG